ncbi:MAG: Fe(3+) ABC transporter substrate-binding protein [Cytophagales bacterium]|nr:Fe(3+) ABC transporter substrate-binding protein [Bernardetiaceae bacterium]MDW8203660.1 Fe(3+) ABC transporter substrate-binding protein [Cytophagales bacterium]
MKFRHFLLAAATVVLLAACSTSNQQNQAEQQATDSLVVNVYTHRHYDADKQLFADFEKLTGIKVNVKTASADELQKLMEMEGANCPADVLLTVDAGRLVRAKDKGLLQPIQSAVLNANIPAHLRDGEGYWYAFTQRARVIVYNKEKVKPSELSTYEELTSPKWKKRILVRPSDNIYNQSLLASIIAHKGEETALLWAKGIVANMAREPKGNDRDQIYAVANGEGDIAIVNSYYLGQMLHSKEAADTIAAKKIGIFFPNQADRGAHMNVSGGGVAKYAPHKENAIKLLEFLSSEQAQKVFAEANQEYPVKPGVPLSATLASWGTFKADTLSVVQLGKFNTAAVKILDAAGWK